MALIETWMPPSREHWEQLVWLWQFFPLFASFQWVVSYYPMGKTSNDSRFNLPGRIGWVLMEAPSFIVLLYLMFTLPVQNHIASLPKVNWVMAALYTIHYIYRALLSPLLLNPSMSPIHPTVFLAALTFQLWNATCLGGWLAGYGPVTAYDWEGRAVWIEGGMMIFALGLLGNIFHDDDLREIRRAAARRQKKLWENDDGAEKRKPNPRKNPGVDKYYQIPQNGLFHLVLYPHHLCEWVEWAGFWMIAGWGCVPARCFLVNEIAAMLPRALNGKAWYVERFGAEKVGGRKAVIPWLI